jgi:mono/diheme cytochrome c family protein
MRRSTFSLPSPALVPLMGAALLAALVPGGLAGCDKLADADMYYQPYHKPYTPSTFYPDGTSARPLVAGTIPRPTAPLDRAGQPGSGIGGLTLNLPSPESAVSSTPGAATGYAMAADVGKLGPNGFPENFPTEGANFADVLARGQERYNIYCSVCHGYNGQGDGMIVQRGFSHPPAFYPLDRDRENNPQLYAREVNLANRPDLARHVYDVISNGYGAMYSYGERVRPEDRWAIATYIKTLQTAKPAPTTAPPSAGIGPDRTRGTSP